MDMKTANTISPTNVLVLRSWPRELHSMSKSEEPSMINFKWISCLMRRIKPKITQTPPKAVKEFLWEIPFLCYPWLKSIDKYSKVEDWWTTIYLTRTDKRARTIQKWIVCWWWTYFSAVQVFRITFMPIAFIVPASILSFHRNQEPKGSNYLHFLNDQKNPHDPLRDIS